jgi:hypothetical protein
VSVSCLIDRDRMSGGLGGVARSSSCPGDKCGTRSTRLVLPSTPPLTIWSGLQGYARMYARMTEATAARTALIAGLRLLRRPQAATAGMPGTAAPAEQSEAEVLAEEQALMEKLLKALGRKPVVRPR